MGFWGKGHFFLLLNLSLSQVNTSSSFVICGPIFCSSRGEDEGSLTVVGNIRIKLFRVVKLSGRKDNKVTVVMMDSFVFITFERIDMDRYVYRERIIFCMVFKLNKGTMTFLGAIFL